MHVSLGVDTLCYHCRLTVDDIPLERVLEEVADTGYEFVQLNTTHLDKYDERGLRDLGRRANGLGLGVTLAGSNVGRAYQGDTIEDGVAKVLAWGEIARAVGSDYVRVSSGFYRTEMGRNFARVLGERDYVVGVLQAVAADFDKTGLKILLENHSDFTLHEYLSIVADVGAPNFEVFLDLINPITMLQDPAEVVATLLPHATAGHIKDYAFTSRYVEDGYHRRGWDVNYCYPGEGVADLPTLVGQLTRDPRPGTYRLSVEGLDNYPDVADQKDRLGTTLNYLKGLL